MVHEPCPNCGDTDSPRLKKQVAEFYEDVDGGTDVLGWGETVYEKCTNCDTVIHEKSA